MLALSHAITAMLVASSPILMGHDFDYDKGIIYLVFAAFGALIVDIDEPHSYIGRRLYFFSFAINMLVQHRTITHSYLIAVTGMVLSLYYWRCYYAFGFFVGMATHILGDEATGNVKGAYWPFSARFSSFPRRVRFRVGGITEYVITTLSAVSLVAIHVYGVFRGIL